MLELIKNWALKVHPYSMTVVWTYTGFEEGLLHMLYFLHVGDIMMIDCGSLLFDIYCRSTWQCSKGSSILTLI